MLAWTKNFPDLEAAATGLKQGIKGHVQWSTDQRLIAFESTSGNTGLIKLLRVTDGTGLARLTIDSANLSTSLNGDSQYPWSNVSRDGSWYAVEQQTSQTSSHPGTLTLFFGSLSGGTSTRFAEMSDGTKLSVVGWTTLS